MKPALMAFVREDHPGAIGARCHACDQSIAVYPAVTQRGTGLRYERPRRPELVAGFVNAKRRHDTGHPWFVRAGMPTAEAFVIRVPAVVTCSCGSDVLLPQINGESGALSGALENLRRRD